MKALRPMMATPTTWRIQGLPPIVQHALEYDPRVCPDREYFRSAIEPTSQKGCPTG